MFTLACIFANLRILGDAVMEQRKIDKNKPTLYIFSGLSGCGKSTLAEKLAEYTNFVYLRIDIIEQGLRDICSINISGEGYRLSYRIAKDNLRIGNSVIADSCNPIALTRKEWQEVAEDLGVNFENIEIICSDKSIHKYRVETRSSQISNLQLPTWQDVQAREYHTWNSFRHVVDTSGKSIEQSFLELVNMLGLNEVIP